MNDADKHLALMFGLLISLVVGWLFVGALMGAFS